MVFDPARRAALFLHAMHERDRGWVIAQLAPAERDSVNTLLAELAVLGIPGDAGLLDSYMEEDATQEEPSQALSYEMAVELLMRVEAGELVALLKAEPDMLVARLLMSHAWPWKRDLLIRLGQPRASRIESCLAGADMAAQACAMNRILLQTAADNLRQQRLRVRVAGQHRPQLPRATRWYSPLVGRLASAGRYWRSR